MTDTPAIPDALIPPSAESLLLAHDILHPEDGGDHLPVKLASARSSRDTVKLAARIDAFAAQASTAAFQAGTEAMRELAGYVAIHDQTPIPMRLRCPCCAQLHIDIGEFATKPHHTHACQFCGEVWRPAVVPTVGVQFLPGFKDDQP